MTRDEIKRFRCELARRMRGDFTPQEKERMLSDKELNRRVYEQIIANCGGKDPIFGK